LHAPIAFRQKRVEELYHVTQQQALKLINSIDQERARYLRALTGADGSDASLYHLCLDTSAIGLDKCELIILEALQARFSDIELAPHEVASD
jgi:cytidylate kinase